MLPVELLPRPAAGGDGTWRVKPPRPLCRTTY